MKGRMENTRKWVVLLCAGAVSMTGCFTRRPPTATFGRYATMRPPVVPAAVGTQLDEPPDIAAEGLAAPPELAIAPSVPAKPRVIPTPSAEPSKPEKQAEPKIVPEFSAQEVEEAKAETLHNLDLMERNLTVSSGRQLNASQQDLVSKVHGFAENAREAMKSGDWVRAKNLSKKAAVLSEELAASL